MKKSSLLFFLLLATMSVYAQELVSSQGDSYSNADASIDFSIGEVLISTQTDGTNTLTQGFHQTNWKLVSIEHTAANYEAIIFPNPTEDVLNIKTNSYEEVKYSLYDALGKLVAQDKLSGEQTTLDMRDLAAGSYSVLLKKGNKNLKTFKLFKIN